MTRQPCAKFIPDRGVYQVELMEEPYEDGWLPIEKDREVIAAFRKQYQQYEVVLGIPSNFGRVRDLAAIDETKGLITLISIEHFR